MPSQVLVRSILVAQPGRELADFLPCANAVWHTYDIGFQLDGTESSRIPIKNVLRIEGESLRSGRIEATVNGRSVEIEVLAGRPACQVSRQLRQALHEKLSADCVQYCARVEQADLDGLVLVRSDPNWRVAGGVDGLVLDRDFLKYPGRDSLPPYYNIHELAALGLNFGESAFGSPRSIEVFVLPVGVEGFDALAGIPGENAIAGLTGRVFLPANEAQAKKRLLAHEFAHILTRLNHGVGGLLDYPPAAQLYNEHHERIFEVSADLMFTTEDLGTRPSCDGLEVFGRASFAESIRRLESLSLHALLREVDLLKGGLKYYALRLAVARGGVGWVRSEFRSGLPVSRVELFALVVEGEMSVRDVLDIVPSEAEASSDLSVGIATLRRLEHLEAVWEENGRPLDILIRELRRAYDPYLSGFAPWDPILGGHPIAVWAAGKLTARFADDAVTRWRQAARIQSMPSGTDLLPIQELPGRIGRNQSAETSV